MSEDTQPETKVNDELTKRLNNAYIPKEFMLFKSSEEGLVMIDCENENGDHIDVLAAFDPLIKSLKDLNVE